MPTCGSARTAWQGSTPRAADRPHLYPLPPYDDQAPIVSISDAHVHLTITEPDPSEVTEDDVARWPPAGRGGGPVRDRAGAPRGRHPSDRGRSWRMRGAGGVMAPQMEAGRLELVPPAAPGFSPVAHLEEVNMLCARS